MEQTWRWYGPNDPVTLADIKQAGATGIVTALQMGGAAGEVWTKAAVVERKALIEAAGLTWSVVESIPVHEEIKWGGPNREQYIENYKISIRNCAAAGIDTFCYNFMPVLDWSRTSLDYVCEDGGEALQFDAEAYAAFDLFCLKRPDAEAAYTTQELAAAKKRFESMSDDDMKGVTENLLKGLPGTTSNAYSLEDFQAALDVYKSMPASQLRENLAHFLTAIVPVAEELGVRMAIHPDDPPIGLFGLPRVVSTEEDCAFLLNCVDTKANGLTLCTGSYGSRADNDVPQMASRFADRIHFVHLRNVIRSPNGSFVESNHLEGDVDMYSVMLHLLKEQKRRRDAGVPELECRLPMRPDHGHKLLQDLKDPRTNPGYPAIGRLRGLAELRGLMMGIQRSDALK